MKKNTFKLTFASLAIGASALASLPALASPGVVPETAQNQIQAGETRDQVIQALGTPRSTPKWRTGETSMVYAVNGGESSNEALYVDLDASGRVANVTLLDNSDDTGQ